MYPAIYILKPLTDKGWEWVYENLDSSHTPVKDGIAIESRYVADVAQLIMLAGLPNLFELNRRIKMACNVCGEKVDVCENCLVELAKSDFKCFENVHFCGKGCWEEWIVKEEEGKLEEAEDDEEEK